MNLILHLPADLEAKLNEQAKATGRPPEDVALAALQDGLANPDEALPALPLDQWLLQFDAWVGIQQSRNPRLDDARESMYPDRW